MRDRRFVAVHRGGPLELATHHRLAAWAADCAEHVLPLFEEHSSDDRPRRAIDAARAWARGEISVGDARKAAVEAHAAARNVKERLATAAARAAGHAVATAHMADHCLGPAIYGVKAVAWAGESGESERRWQLDRIETALRGLVVSALETVRRNERAPKRNVLKRSDRGIKLRSYVKTMFRNPSAGMRGSTGSRRNQKSVTTKFPRVRELAGMTTKLTKLIPFIMLGLTAIFFVGCAAETTTSTTTTQTDRTRSSMYAR